MKTAKVNEIFTSIQGEGLYVGTKQLFVRFCGCNLKCNYCDTEFMAGHDYTTDELVKIIEGFDLQTLHSISLTGGEPLLWADFLLRLLPKLHTKIYLETNSSLPKELEKVIKFIDVIAADIKLKSCSGMEYYDGNEAFFAVARNYGRPHLDVFAKIIFDETVTDEEIKKCCSIARKYDLEIILQPRMIGNDFAISKENITEVFERFLKLYPKIRVIPQVHKLVGVR